MQVIAADRGRGELVDKTVDKTGGQVAAMATTTALPTVGELILNYQHLTERWLKDSTDFNRLVKDAVTPLAFAEVEKAAAKDADEDNANAEVASLLVNRAFFEVAEIDPAQVMTYEQQENGELKLPTTGKDFLHRLRKVGVGSSIKNYRMAMLSPEELTGREAPE